MGGASFTDVVSSSDSLLADIEESEKYIVVCTDTGFSQFPRVLGKCGAV